MVNVENWDITRDPLNHARKTQEEQELGKDWHCNPVKEIPTNIGTEL